MNLDKRVSRRSVLQGAAATGAALAAGSLLPKVAQASADSAALSGTLSFYAAQYTPAKPTKTVPNPPVYLGTVVKNYQALHPGVTIDLLPYSTSGSSLAFTQWKATQFAGGTEPDIIYNNPVDADNLDVPKSWYLPLDSYLSKPNPYVPGNKAWADLFGTGILANVTNANGHVYNLAMDAIDTAIFYNKDAFTKAGISGAPTSYAEWMDDMAALKKAGFIPYWLNAGAGGSDYMDWHERQLVDMLFYTDAAKFHAIPGGSKTSFQLTSVQTARAIQSGMFKATDPRYLEVLTLLKELAGYAEPGFEGVPTTGSPYSLFSAGKLAMFQGTTFDINGLAALHLSFPYSSFEAVPPLTKDTTPLASGVIPGKIGIVGAFANYNVTIGVNRDKNLALAIDWLQYLSQPSTGGHMVTQLGALVPTLKNVPVPEGLKVFLPSSGRRDALISGYVSRLDAQFSSQYYHVLQPFLLGQMDVNAAASQIQGLMSAAATRVLAAAH